jgi:hypothetical protein
MSRKKSRSTAQEFAKQAAGAAPTRRVRRQPSGRLRVMMNGYKYLEDQKPKKDVVVVAGVIEDRVGAVIDRVANGARSGRGAARPGTRSLRRTKAPVGTSSHRGCPPMGARPPVSASSANRPPPGGRSTTSPPPGRVSPTDPLECQRAKPGCRVHEAPSSHTTRLPQCPGRRVSPLPATTVQAQRETRWPGLEFAQGHAGVRACRSVSSALETSYEKWPPEARLETHSWLLGVATRLGVAGGLST